ncbi:hypothetical protein J6590_032110 [Homalodisca vitripennis]|nr:hypothetical protein J6590_032110 [Homalodisca vitripennis]
MGKYTLEALKTADVSRIRKAEIAAQLATKESRIKRRRLRLGEEEVDDPHYCPESEVRRRSAAQLVNVISARLRKDILQQGGFSSAPQGYSHACVTSEGAGYAATLGVGFSRHLRSRDQLRAIRCPRLEFWVDYCTNYTDTTVWRMKI